MATKTPQYNNYHPTSLKASKTGRGNKRSGTKPERSLIHSLRELGIYVHSSKRQVQGNPDLVFWKKRLAIFCDGDFWHGRNWQIRRKKLKEGANASYWIKKIEYNRLRDRENNKVLKENGWKVIRVWESTILKNPKSISQRIKRVLFEK